MRKTLENVLLGAILAVVAVFSVIVLFPPPNRVVYAQTHFNTCEQSSTTATYLGATSGTAAVQIVPLVAGTPVYVCFFEVTGVSGTTPTFSLVYGTGTNCATGQHLFLNAGATTANVPLVFPGTYVGAIPAGNAVCYLDGGTTPVQNYILVVAQS